MIDGTSNTDTALGTPAAILSVDAIQEFKEQTTTYSAEYGFSANQINLVSKTGTNALHGTGFGFFRNDALDARNFFDDRTQAPKLDQKQFGFVVGGPVMLPGLRRPQQDVLPGQLRRHCASNAARTTSTRCRRRRSWRAASPRTIIDPATGQPFPNNTIPQSRFSRLAQLALAELLVPGAEQPAPRRATTRPQRTLPQTDTNQFTDPRSIRISAKLGRGVRPLHEVGLRRTRPPAT